MFICCTYIGEARESDEFGFFDDMFFPLGDNEGFGKELGVHNYHYSTQINTTFIYHPGQYFTVDANNVIFVFVNGKKLVDDGGVGGLFRDIYLDDYVELCNLEDGKEAVSHCVIAP